MQKFGKSANADGGLPMIVLLKDTNIDTDISVILEGFNQMANLCFANLCFFCGGARAPGLLGTFGHM